MRIDQIAAFEREVIPETHIMDGAKKIVLPSISLEGVDLHIEIGKHVESRMIAVYDLHDKMVRDALIALGWTPPEESVDA